MFSIFWSHSFSNCVHHLGHVLSFNLDDTEDINRQTEDIKLFCLLQIVSHFMELFPGFFVLSIKSLEATFSNVLRKIGTCLSFVILEFYIVSLVFRVCITLLYIFSSSAFNKAIASDCRLNRHCLLSSSASVYTFTGFNSRYKYDFIKKYSNDITCANFVRDIRLNLLSFDSVDVTNYIMYSSGYILK